MPYFDYPDPVIASYLQCPSALGPGRNPMAPLLDQMQDDDGFTVRVVVSALRALASAGGWWIVRGTTRNVSDKTARLAYRALFTMLRREGWDRSAIQPVALGLMFLRGRETSAESARRGYELVIGERIPAASIGW